jgi:hypothetical protein
VLELISGEDKKILNRELAKDPKMFLAKKIKEYILKEHNKSNITSYQ